MPTTPLFAAVANRTGLDTQGLLAQNIADWRTAGHRIAGVLAENASPELGCAAGTMRDIATGQQISIRQEGPVDVNACQLEPDGVAQAARMVLEQIATADLIVLSKFGKLEARQQGLWQAFEAVLDAEKPLLTTVSAREMPIFRDAYAARIVWLEPGDVRSWGDQVLMPRSFNPDV